MSNRPRVALRGLAAFLIAMASSTVRMAAQNKARQASTFEVASVKPNPDPGPPGDVPVNADKSLGHFAMRDRPLRYIVEWAYDLKDYQIAGPTWIRYDQRYDITATAPGPATGDQMRPMLRALLAERFQMKSHFEKRELNAYALVKGKGEPKLKMADPNTALNFGSLVQGKLRFANSPLSRLTFLLTRRMDRPALDLTGLPGNFDYMVNLSGLGYGNNSSGYEGDGPSVFQAIQNDLGLKLEPGRYPVDVLVIDSVNKVPSRN